MNSFNKPFNKPIFPGFTNKRVPGINITHISLHFIPPVLFLRVPRGASGLFTNDRVTLCSPLNGEQSWSLSCEHLFLLRSSLGSGPRHASLASGALQTALDQAVIHEEWGDPSPQQSFCLSGTPPSLMLTALSYNLLSP